jgi:hypothetical protein
MAQRVGRVQEAGCKRRVMALAERSAAHPSCIYLLRHALDSMRFLPFA